jgi:hypothetical protein
LILFDKFSNVLLQYVGHYTNKLQKISLSEGKYVVNITDNDHFPIVIIGREHCYESFRDLPIAKAEEAIAAASHLGDVSPFEGVSYFVVQSLADDKTRIHFCTIKQEIFELFSSRALIIIPESILLFGILQKNAQRKYALKYQSKSRGLAAVYKHQRFTSIIKEASADDFDIPQQMIDIELDSNKIDVISESDYYKKLTKQLIKLPRYVIKSAFNALPFKQKVHTLPVKTSLIAGLSVFLFYMLSSSAWLLYKANNAETNLFSQKQSLNQVFALQSTMLEASQANQALSNNTKISEITSPVWSVLLDLVSIDAELLAVSYFDKEYSIRVKSEKSTDVIEFLSKQKTISPPKLVSPAVKSRGREIIKLTFKYIGEESSNESS